MNFRICLKAVQTLTQIPISFITLMMGALITLLALRGIGVIGRLASFCMPLLLGTMGWAALRVTPQWEMGSIAISGLAISTVVATAITATFNLPTYFRHAKSRKDALISVALAFGVALPLIELLGVYVAIGRPGTGLIAALQGSGGFLWSYWIVLFLVLAGWTTNNNNLYSAATCLQLLVRKWSQAVRIGVLGLAGSCLACLPLLDNLPLVLKVIGVVVISGGGVTLTAYLTGQKVPFALCLAGCAAGWIGFSGVSTVDAAIASIAVTMIWKFLRREYAISVS